MPYVFNPFTDNLDNIGPGGTLSNPVTPTQGGTGVSNPTANTVPIAEGASNFNFVGPGTANQVLTSNGAGVDPSFKAISTQTSSSAFWANTSVSLSNVTGDGTNYTVVFDNLTYGQNGSAYNTSTGIYTAPSTGWYVFTYAMCLTGVTGSHTDCNCDLQTTDAFGLLYRSISNPAALKDPAGNVTVYDSRVVHLAATNTIKVVVSVFSGAKVVGLLGPQSTVQMYTSFGGALISL